MCIFFTDTQIRVACFSFKHPVYLLKMNFEETRHVSQSLVWSLILSDKK